MKGCVDAHWSTPEWVEQMLALKAPASPPEPIGWPVGTLVHNKANGRRGRIHSAHSNQVNCSIEFDDGAVWPTTWDVVLRNYSKV